MSTLSYKATIGAVVLVLLSALATRAQVTSHHWSHDFGSPGTDTGVDIAIDPTGKTVVFGEFRGTAKFGSDDLVSAGYRDIFVAKFDTAGNCLWSRRFGSAASETAGGIAIDDDGSIFLTGTFRSAVDFGGGPLIPAGDDDIYLVQLDPDGVHVRSQGFGDSGPDVALDVATVSNTHVYVTGTFGGTLDFGGGALVSAGGPDMFIVQLKKGTDFVHVWSEAFGDGGSDSGNGVIVDHNSHVYVTGHFEGEIDFGGGPLPSNGLKDVFLVKFSSAGAHLWSDSHGGSKDDSPNDVAVDPSGYVVIAGSFQSTADFGGTPLTSQGDEDIFLARYHSTGSHIWSEGFGGPDADVASGVAVNPDKEIHITGHCGDAVDFGGGALPIEGDPDLFLAKFENTGAHLWSHTYGGRDEDHGAAVAVDASGALNMIGSFRSRPGEFGGDPLYSRGATFDILVASYDENGAHRWSEKFGDSGFEEGRDLVSDDHGNVFVTGIFCGSVGFGGDILVSSGQYDIFLAKYDELGNHLWSRSFESTFGTVPAGQIPGDQGNSLALDGDGNLYLTGWFEGTVDFGGGPLTAVGDRDIFLAKYDGAGTHLWSRTFGGSDYDGGYAVATDPLRNVYLTGHFRHTVNFGGGPLVSAGDSDIFLASYDAAGTHRWSLSAGGLLGETSTEIAVDDVGDVVIAGPFQSTLDFGGGAIPCNGDYDVFVAKFDLFGTHIWSQGFGSTDWEHVYSMDIDGAGNIILTGDFRAPVSFGGDILDCEGSSDIFVAKYKPGGTHLWSQRFGDDNLQRPGSVDTDDAGNILLSGSYLGSVDLGGGPFTAVGGPDFFLAEFNSFGTHLWSERFGSEGTANVNAAHLVDPTTVVLTGYFDETLDFGGADLTCRGGKDMFLAQLGFELVGVDDADDVAQHGNVGLITPNPFRSGATMQLDLPAAGRTRVTIVDVAGRHVRTLLHRGLKAGRHEIVWDGRNTSGHVVSPGVYAVHVQGEHATLSHKIVRIDSR